MTLVVHFALGLLFGIGLVVSGMADPAKVLNFLDPLGDWDPSLAFVMAAAVTVTFIGYRIAVARGRPARATRFQFSARTDLNLRIIAGPAIFGIGWGLGGLCPGPALTGLGLGAPGVLVFVPAMLVGMGAARMLGWLRQTAAQAG